VDCSVSKIVSHFVGNKRQPKTRNVGCVGVAVEVGDRGIGLCGCTCQLGCADN